MGHLGPRLPCWDGASRRRSIKAQRLSGAGGGLEAHDNVCETGLKVFDADVLADQSSFANRPPALDYGGVDGRGSWFAAVAATRRQLDVEGKTHIALRWGLPENVVGVGFNLADLEEGGTDLMCRCSRSKANQSHQAE